MPNKNKIYDINNKDSSNKTSLYTLSTNKRSTKIQNKQAKPILNLQQNCLASSTFIPSKLLQPGLRSYSPNPCTAQLN